MGKVSFLMGSSLMGLHCLNYTLFPWYVRLPFSSNGKETATQETKVPSLGWEVPLKTGMAIHFSILAWRIPWSERPGELQSMGSQNQA